jgi:hypothetical protein
MRQTEKLWVETKYRYDAHLFPESSDDFRLADGRPLWHALLPDPNVLVLNAAEANRARSQLRHLFGRDPGIVRKCIGGSLQDASRTLRPIALVE